MTLPQTHWFNYEFIGAGPIKLRMRLFYDKPGGRIFAPQFIAAKFLERAVDLEQLELKDKKVLELTSGCALPSVIAGMLGAEVVATNEKAGMIVTEPSVLSNKYYMDPIEKKMATINIRPAELNLGTTGGFAKGSFDYIIGSDLISVVPNRHALFATLLQLCGPNTVVLFSHLWARRPIEEDFLYKQLGEFFDVHETATDSEVTAFAEVQLQNSHPNSTLEERRRSSSITIESIMVPKRRMSDNPLDYEEEGISIIECRLKPEFAAGSGLQIVEAKVAELLKLAAVDRKDLV